MHHLRLLRGKSLNDAYTPKGALCTAEGCNEPIGSGGRGLCRFHYDRLRCGIRLDLPRLERYSECRICGKKEHHAKGLCPKCYSREQSRKSKDRTPVPRVKRTGCKVEGCEGKHRALGFCTKHYYDQRRVKFKRPEKLSKIEKIKQYLDYPTLKEENELPKESQESYGDIGCSKYSG